MSIIYNGKEVVKLKRILELNEKGKPVITLWMPEENYIQGEVSKVFTPDTRIVQLPIKEKIKLSNIDIVNPPIVEENQLTVKGFLATYKKLAEVIDYETKNSEQEKCVEGSQ